MKKRKRLKPVKRKRSEYVWDTTGKRGFRRSLLTGGTAANGFWGNHDLAELTGSVHIHPCMRERILDDGLAVLQSSPLHYRPPAKEIV